MQALNTYTLFIFYNKKAFSTCTEAELIFLCFCRFQAVGKYSFEYSQTIAYDFSVFECIQLAPDLVS